MITLDSVNFDATIQKTEVILVDFYAHWCTPCRMVTPILEELSKKYNVAKVNVDLNAELAQRFDIHAIPAMVLFKNGQAIETLVGLQEQEVLQTLLESAVSDS